MLPWMLRRRSASRSGAGQVILIGAAPTVQAGTDRLSKNVRTAAGDRLLLVDLANILDEAMMN